MEASHHSLYLGTKYTEVNAYTQFLRISCVPSLSPRHLHPRVGPICDMSTILTNGAYFINVLTVILQPT